MLFKTEITPEDIANTESKFFLWDKALKEGLNKQNILLLNDPSIWAYAHLRDPTDITKRYKVNPIQDVILNDKNRFVLAVGAYQIGKTDALRIGTMQHATMNPNQTCLICSKSIPQSSDVLHGIKNFLLQSHINFTSMIVPPDNRTELYLSNGSRIVCVPATESALGYPAHKMCIDELGTYENGVDVYKRILETRTYYTKGQVIIFANTRGQQGILWELWNNPKFSRYQFSLYNCPRYTSDEIEKMKVGLTNREIREYIYGEFLPSSGGFFTPDEIIDAENEKLNIPGFSAEPVFIFVDLAKVHDQSVIGVGKISNPSEPHEKHILEVIETLEFPQGTDYTQVGGDTMRIYEKYPNAVSVGVDATGTGKSFVDFMTEKKLPIIPVIFSLQEKARMYTTLKLLFEERRIKIPKIPKLNYQLSHLTFKRTSGGQLQVHHENESDLDDYPDMLAGLAKLAINSYIPPKIEFVAIKSIKDRNKPNLALKTVICPICEAEGKEPYHQSEATKYFELVNCLEHS